MNTIKTLWSNLEKWQKITTVVLLQFIVIIILTATVNSFIKERNHIDIIDETNQTEEMPAAAKEEYEKVLWEIIEANVEGVDKSVIKDAKIREGSYKKEVSEDGTVQVNFLVDIDSIKQSYRVVLGWNKQGEVIQPQIGCPMPVLGETTKYPESYCQGTYRNSQDLELYLPYEIKSPFVDEYSFAAPDVYIEGDELNQTITVFLTTCDTDSNKQKALDYLNSTAIDLSKYQINYEVSSLDAICEGDI